MKKGVWLSLLLMITWAAVSARTFHVATDGSDKNPGNKMEPLRPFQKAVGAAHTGDTTLVRGDPLVWSGRVGDHAEEREQINIAEPRIIPPSSAQGVTTNVQDVQWMETGVWTACLRNRRLGPGRVVLNPGFHKVGDGSFDRKETVMAFDGERS